VRGGLNPRKDRRGLDPTREETCRFLDRLFGEMAVLFPFPFLHVGGLLLDHATGRVIDRGTDLTAE
jgi:N-acetyl-beta-hexosaminidase